MREAVASLELAFVDDPSLYTAPIPINELHEFLSIEGQEPVRKPTGEWIQPPLKTPSLLSPPHFRFLNETHDLLSAADWNNTDREKLWLYHLHYFDDLNVDGAEQRVDWHTGCVHGIMGILYFTLA